MEHEVYASELMVARVLPPDLAEMESVVGAALATTEDQQEEPGAEEAAARFSDPDGSLAYATIGFTTIDDLCLRLGQSLSLSRYGSV
jgi:hypothetical protein